MDDARKAVRAALRGKGPHEQVDEKGAARVRVSASGARPAARLCCVSPLALSCQAIARRGEAELGQVHDVLVDYLSVDSSRTRCRVLVLVDALYCRSRAFRRRFDDKLRVLLDCAVGVRADRPLPKPADAAVSSVQHAASASPACRALTRKPPPGAPARPRRRLPAPMEREARQPIPGTAPSGAVSRQRERRGYGCRCSTPEVPGGGRRGGGAAARTGVA